MSYYLLTVIRYLYLTCRVIQQISNDVNAPFTSFAFGTAAQEPANGHADQKHHENQYRPWNKKGPEKEGDVYDGNILKYEKDGQRSKYQADDLLEI